MKDEFFQKLLLKLVGRGALAYAYHEADHSLSVVDRHGRKFLFGWGDYQHLLPKPQKLTLSKARTKPNQEQYCDHTA